MNRAASICHWDKTKLLTKNVSILFVPVMSAATRTIGLNGTGEVRPNLNVHNIAIKRNPI